MRSPFLLLSCLVAANVVAAFIPASYTASVAIAAGRGRFHWRLSGTPQSADERGYFALEVPTTAGWIGFGVGEINSGSMPGSDMAIFTVDVNGALTVGDYHALDFTTPIPDCNPAASDWSAVAAVRNATHTVVEFSRLLKVSSLDEDRPIERRPNDSPSKFLVAWGTSATLAYHGRADRALFAVDIFSAPVDRLAQLRADPNIEVLTWRMYNATIPAVETTYASTACFERDFNDGGRQRQIVAFNVIVSDPANVPFLHHMVVKGYNTAGCNGRSVDLYAVASSHAPFLLPSDIGIGMSYASFDVEIHYDNPQLLSGVYDTSGVEIFTIPPGGVQREHTAGVLVAADPFVQTPYLLDPGYTGIDYDCPSECTARWENNITVFGELLHMHATGNLMRSEFVSPDGRTIIATREAEWYAFHTQENQLVDRFVVPRGSSINTRCVFKVAQSGGRVQFGIASSEEMCMHFIYYYPQLEARTAQMCGAFVCGNIRSTDHAAERHQRNTFNGSCGVVGLATPTPAPLVSIASLADRLSQAPEVSAAPPISAGLGSLLIASAVGLYVVAVLAA